MNLNIINVSLFQRSQGPHVCVGFSLLLKKVDFFLAIRLKLLQLIIQH